MSKLKKSILLFLPVLLLVVKNGQCQETNYVIKSGASPTLTNSGIFLAKELGYFGELGLNVEILTENTAGASQTMLLATGQLDTGGGGFSSGLWNAINQGEGIKIVACKSYATDTSSHWSLIVRKDLVENGKYTAFKDLKGFKMTLPALKGSGPEVLLDAYLRAGGLTYDDIEIIKMPYADVNIALENKTIDATVQVEPYSTKAVMDGNAVRVSLASDILPGDQGAGIFYSKNFMKNHPDLAVKWMMAYIKAVRAYNDAFFKGINKDKIIQMLKKYVKIENDEIWQKSIPAHINPNGYLKMDSVQKNLNWYYEKGYIDKIPSIDEVVDNSYVDKALEKIGMYKK